MKLRKLTILFFIFLSISSARSQTIVEPSPVKWYTVEQSDSMFKIMPKPILIDVYTDWCGWCKHMMKTTFSNPGIASYINLNFYPVRFDAEGYDTLTYQNKIYINKGLGKKPKHDFATYILNGRFSFPTIVYIDKKRNLYRIPGYMNVKDIEPILVYFSEEIHLNAKYDDWKLLYQFNYPSNYRDEIIEADKNKIPDTSGHVNWKNFKNASESCLKDQKPIFIYFYTDWCLSCKVISGTVFRNPVLAKLLNENFHPVIFNAASQNEEILFGESFKGNGKNNPHNITYGLLKQSFKFPAFVFLNSKKQKINEIHGFIVPYQMEILFNYFIGEAYKKYKYKEFIKTFSGEIKK